MPRPPEPDPPSRLAVPRSSQGLESARSSDLSRTRNSSLMRGEGSNVKMKELTSFALSALQTITSLVSEAGSDVGVPGLSIGLSVLEKILEKIETMSSTVDGIETLVDRIGKLRTTLEEFRGRKVPPYMQKRIVVLSREWERFCGDGKKVKSRNAVMRFLRSSKDAEQLKRLVEKFNASFEHFQFETILNTAAAVHAMADNIQVQHDESFMPPYAQYAAYDANEARQGCLKGTRVGVLREIWGEIEEAAATVIEDGGDRPRSHESCGKIILIEGRAGTGKSTIAYSIAEECPKRDILSASFCCSRSDDQCSDTRFILPTIASQLARRYVPFKEKVVEAMKRNPDILAAGPARQMEELILRPLEDLKDILPIIVIVIDALDECGNPNSLTILMKVLATYIHRLRAFVFVFTTRPEPYVTTQFDPSRKETLGPATKVIALHEISQDQVDADLGLYLDDGFTVIRAQFGLRKEWPCREDRVALVDLARGLFIYARTALRFIEHTAYRDPAGRLELLLARRSEAEGSTLVLDDLDKLYCEILQLSPLEISTELEHRIQTILGAVLFCQRPLPIPVLSLLIGIPVDKIRAALSGLHSVLYIPGPEDDAKPIRILHPTFREFLIRSLPPRHSAFYVQPAEQHALLALRCFALTCDLKRNVVNIEGPSTTFVTEVPDLSQRSAIHIPPHLQYAYVYWSLHLSLAANANSVANLFEPARSFMETRLLFWLEACAWLKKFDSALTSLDQASQTCQALGGSYAELAPLLQDCRRFAFAYIDCICTAPLEMYRSALAVAPSSSTLARTYQHELKLSSHLEVQRGALEDWGPCLAAFAAHGGRDVNIVSFSPDCASFATGGDDGKLKIWEARTCTLLLSIDAHPNASLCGANYSPDGAYIATGSDDKTVRIWDISTGHRISILAGHTGSIFYVEYSMDGLWLLSASVEGELKLWDVSDSNCIVALYTGVQSTSQAAISSDGTCIAHGADNALCLYHVDSKTVERLDLQGQVRGTAFSSDASYVAAGTFTTIRIWTMVDRLLVRSIFVPQGLFQLAFSADGAQIGCGCGDGSIRLWEARSEEPPRVLTGHTRPVHDITWSLNSSRLVSAGLDGTVRIWDITGPNPIPPVSPRADVHTEKSVSPPHFVVACNRADTAITFFRSPSSFNPSEIPDDAPSLTWCPDALSSWDAASRLSLDDRDVLDSLRCSNGWECWTGQGHSQLGAHTISFSDDGELMGYRSETSDTVVRVCSLRTGQPTVAFPEHDSTVTSIAFSPTSAHLVTGLNNGRVTIWSIASGRCITSYEEHTNRVSAVALSPETRYALSGSWDKTTRIFDMASNHVVHTLGHDTWVVNVVFAADGVHVITQDGWNQIHIWGRATGTRVIELDMRLNVDLKKFDYFPDGRGTIHFQDDNATTHTILVRQDPRRTWPVHLVDDSGWVYAKDPRGTRRVAWLPPEWRMLLPSENQQLYVWDASQQAVVVIDLSQLLPDSDLHV